MELIRLSVRELVEFLLRTGSIDSRFSGFDRANEGARIHRRLQKEAGPGYESEVFLRGEWELEGLLFRVEGRADGVFLDEAGRTVVDEIKTTTLPQEQITENHQPLHWAQGRVYAAILAGQRGLTELDVRLTYYQTDTDAILRYTHHETAPALEAFVLELLRQYLPWARLRLEWAAARTQSLQALGFPFAAYRPGQRAMAGEIYRAFRDGAAGKGGGRVFCQAPTGIGKTLSALFPALKAMGEGKGERVFYLTARTTTQAAAENALALLRAQNGGGALALRTLTLTSKEKSCFCAQPLCTPEACPYANGYYDRVKDALQAGLALRELSREQVVALARQFTVCPFELGLDLSLWCDVIVCDYNYLFDPVVCLKRFFDSPGEHLFLVDEAHNLPARAREMHSAGLEQAQFAQGRKALRQAEGEPSRRGRRQDKAGRLNTALGKVLQFFRAQKEPCQQAPGRTLLQAGPLEELNSLLARLCTPLQDWLEVHREGEAHNTLLELYFAVRGWLRVAEVYDEHYITQLALYGRAVTVRQLCLDPSAFVDRSLALGRGAALFSATLTPPGYYKDLCGCAEARAVALPSPFPPQNLGLFCANGISTKYQDRSASLTQVADALAAMAEAHTGNYMAFFPSYAYLTQVLDCFAQRYPHIDTLVQESGMTDAARADFLARFDPAPQKTLLGFGVLGGVFGEGIDLTGERLIGVAVVGVGLPQVNPRQEALRGYFESTRGSGFDYAYRYPGWNKVLQAAGRVIRTAADRGVVVLVDQRFAWPSYRALMPAHWQHLRQCPTLPRLRQGLQEFWQSPDA